MYPLHTWGYHGVRDRLNLLIASDLHYEAVVVSAQTVEQVLKRVIRSELSTARKLVAVAGKGPRHLTAAGSLEDIDVSLRHHCKGLDDIKTTWSLVMKGSPAPRLTDLVDKVCGPGSWHRLAAPHHCHFRNSNGVTVRVRYGLFRARHLLVHSPNAPDGDAIRILSHEGVRIALGLLHPGRGIVSAGLRNPLMKAFPFRKVP